MTILRSTDNPHELLDIKCNACRERLIATREEANAAGWGLVEHGGYYDDDDDYGFHYVQRYDVHFCPAHFTDQEDD